VLWKITRKRGIQCCKERDDEFSLWERGASINGEVDENDRDEGKSIATAIPEYPRLSILSDLVGTLMEDLPHEFQSSLKPVRKNGAGKTISLPIPWRPRKLIFDDRYSRRRYP
jgi:hypothetical protein